MYEVWVPCARAPNISKTREIVTLSLNEPEVFQFIKILLHTSLYVTVFFLLTGLDSDAKQNYRPSFMDHFDRIFEAGGRGSDSGPNGSSVDDSGGILRGVKPEDPFRLKKAGPPDFEFVSVISIRNLLYSIINRPQESTSQWLSFQRSHIHRLETEASL